MLGIQLLDQEYVATLYTIKSENKNAEESCTEMFIEWLATDADASWNKLIKALRSPSVKLTQLAGTLQNMLPGYQKPVCSYSYNYDMCTTIT